MNKNTLVLCLGLAATTAGAMQTVQEIKNEFLQYSRDQLFEVIVNRIDGIVEQDDEKALKKFFDSVDKEKQNKYAKLCLHEAAGGNCLRIGRYLLESCLAPVDCLNQADETALFVAAKNRNDEFVKLLLEYKANASALHYSVMRCNPRALLCLLQNGVNVNKKDAYGRSALHHLAKYKNDPYGNMLEWLYAYGADFDAKDGEGQTPVQIAEAVDNQDFMHHFAYLTAEANADKGNPDFKFWQ